jgi:predicted MFS family arabinose efflux permease
VSWESIFYVNIPVGIVGFFMTLFIVPDSRDTSRSRKVDPPGLVTGTAGIFFLVYGLIEGNARGWTDGLILGAFVLSGLLLLTFFVVESRRPSPMLPLSFWRIPTFTASNIVAAAVFFALFGVTFFLTLYLQNVQGYSPVAAGLRLFPFTLMILLLAPVSGRLSDKYGSRWFMTGGTFMAAVGMALLIRTQVGSSYATVLLPAFLVLGAGLAITMAPMTSAVMGSVEPRHAGVASAATNTTRELGGVFGIALLGAIVTSSARHGLLSHLVSGGLSPGAAPGIAQASGGVAAGAAPAANGPIAFAVHASFVHAIHVAMTVGVFVILLASVLSALFVRSHVQEDVPEGERVYAAH